MSECLHDHVAIHNGVPRCVSCATWLPTGRCGRCGKPLDDKPHIYAVACGAEEATGV